MWLFSNFTVVMFCNNHILSKQELKVEYFIFELGFVYKLIGWNKIIKYINKYEINKFIG